MGATPTSSEILVSEGLIEEIVGAEAPFCREIRHCDPRTGVMNLVREQKAAFALIEPFLGISARPRILEIGSGNGFGLCYMLKAGLDVVGVEPGDRVSFEGRFERAERLLEMNGFTPAAAYLHRGLGEALPFGDDTFDLIVSTAVLEHVQDVASCLTEAWRVTRPGGVMIMSVPNYNSAYEGHYDVSWPPYVLAHNKPLAKWYVRNVVRRPDYYLDELHFTTPRPLHRLIRALPRVAEARVFHLVRFPFGAVSAVHYHLSLGHVSKHPLLALVATSPLMSRLVRGATGAAATLLAWLAWAPMFCLVSRKAPAGTTVH